MYVFRTMHSLMTLLWIVPLISGSTDGLSEEEEDPPPSFTVLPRKKFARGPPLGGMSCSDGLPWLTLRRGARP